MSNTPYSIDYNISVSITAPKSLIVEVPVCFSELRGTGGLFLELGQVLFLKQF